MDGAEDSSAPGRADGGVGRSSSNESHSEVRRCGSRALVSAGVRASSPFKGDAKAAFVRADAADRARLGAYMESRALSSCDGVEMAFGSSFGSNRLEPRAFGESAEGNAFFADSVSRDAKSARSKSADVMRLVIIRL